MHYNHNGEGQVPRNYGEGYPSGMGNEQYQNYMSEHYMQTSSSAPIFPNTYDSGSSGAYPPHDSQYNYAQGYPQPSYSQQSHGAWDGYPQSTGPAPNQAYWSNANQGMPSQYSSQHSSFFDDSVAQVARQGNPLSSRGMGNEGNYSQRSCMRCHTTTSNSWGQDPRTGELLCSACALHRQQRYSTSSSSGQTSQNTESRSSSGRAQSSKAGQKCTHCGTTDTMTWRRDKDKNLICNACGVYAQVLGKERPLSLAPSVYKPRPKSQASQNIRFRHYNPSP
ncbi:hypothetical protein VKT23_010754 [Stygiomarasmius scandens]|uniref:GATA-type domain-containing protein n=1 Tax=Marasmiellus scandens TaxID=2682957 RepID=A0ABR1JDU2_9AGAR